MLTLVTSVALAAPPFEVGALEPLPVEPTALAVHRGRLVALSETGVRVRRDEGWQTLDLPGGTGLLSAGDDLYICGPTGVVRVGWGTETVSEVPCVGIAAADDGIWILGAEGVTTLEGQPVELPAVPERIGGGPERAWLAGNELHLEGAARLVFPGTSDLAALTHDGERQWLLLHPERRLAGLLGGVGLESAWPLPFAARHVAVGDLGSDGTVDVVVAGEGTWTTLAFGSPKVAVRPPVVTPAPPTVTLPPRKRWEPPQTTNMLGIQMPNFGGLTPDPDYDAIFIGGFGVAYGGAIGQSQVPISRFSPSAAGGIERGANRIRTFFGADSAPLFIWVGTGDSAVQEGIHLAMATAGMTVGSDRLRAGPFVSAGLLGAAAGVRTVFTPFESRAGKLTGIEGRLTWFVPGVAHASLYYVSAFPLGRRVPDSKRPDVRSSVCDRFGLSAGAAGGFSSTASAWEFVGTDRQYQFSGSPVVTLACDVGAAKSAGWLLGAETAPFFFYRVPIAHGGSDRELHHAGSVTFGPWVGSDRARVGPIATLGVFTLGGGVRAVVTPFSTKQGAWHGLELRATALFPSLPAFQGMVLWHVWFDPKVKPKAE
ncbi:MAG: hypothetical protein KC656_11915 [Myxococcales bacterium]|nr:hypothetical protein [Myxococcales bacterium]